MSKRFGRNQKRKLTEMLLRCQSATLHAQDMTSDANDRVERIMREQLSLGKIPLQVEHFLSREQRGVIIHAIFDQQRQNLHYQHQVSVNELRLQRDSEERERLGKYLGRAIADSLAEAFAGKTEGSTLQRGRS